MDRLYDKLISYVNKDYYPMHMPGHKRNEALLQMDNPYMLDITEIEGFDNLHQPEGILDLLSQRISRLYGAGKSFPLINGSTAGILAGICGATRRGDKVLIARNAHRSVYHAVMLMGLTPVYIYPQQSEDLPVNGGISSREIKELLISDSDIRLVIITSPSYEGVVSDICSIAKVVHSHGALLFVDEAHGAHFGFHEGFPQSAITQGADLVVQSLHKTLPSFTQTAVLHSNIESLNDRIAWYLSIYQSSSPSYLLMAGIDRCISMLEDNGRELFLDYYNRLTGFYHSMKALKNLEAVTRELIGKAGVSDLDPSKITISVRNTDITGPMLMKTLRDAYHIEMEMAAPDYVLGMTGICDTQEGFSRLSEALLEIDSRTKPVKDKTEPKRIIRPMQVKLPWEAAQLKTQRVKLEDSSQKISAALISLFPPGVPLIVPGERMEEEMIRYLMQAKQEGLTVSGFSGDGLDELEICGEE